MRTQPEQFTGQYTGYVRHKEEEVMSILSGFAAVNTSKHINEMVQ